MALPNKDLRQVYHVACTVGEVTNGHLETRLSKLCTSQRVNFWSKYKPVKYAYAGGNDIRTEHPTWWRASNNMCGIYIPHSVGNVDAILNGEWSFDAPSGGSNEPFRLGDFRGYNHSATYFITGWLPPETVYLDPDSPYLTVKCALFSPTQENNLQPQDSPVISKFRLGLKITSGSGRSYIQTSDKTIGEAYNDSGILQVRVYMKDIPFVTNDVFTIQQFLTPSTYNTMGTFPTIIDCYSMPNYWAGYVNQIKTQYKVVAPGLDITCTGLASSLSGTYRTEEYYMKNPFLVTSNTQYEYFRWEIINYSESVAKSFTVNDFVYHGQNIYGDDVSCSYANDMKLYNSSMSEIYQLTVQPKAKVTAYVRTRLFRKGTIPSSGMTPVISNVYAVLNLPSEGIRDRVEARFEANIKGA